MTTSDYLKIQADLLIARNLLARLRLEEFLSFTSDLQISGLPLLDRQGIPVSTDPVQMAAIAEKAKELVRVAAWTSGQIARRGVMREEGPEKARAAAV